MRTVFLDTVGLLAVWDLVDQWHGAAEPIFQTLLKERARLVTTPLVLYECGNAAARKPYRATVNAVRLELQKFNDLHECLPADIDQAWTEYTHGMLGGNCRSCFVCRDATIGNHRGIHERSAFSGGGIYDFVLT
jgi:hypothetical protein